MKLNYFGLLLCFAYSVSWGQNVNLIKKLKSDLTKAGERKQFELLSDLSWEYRRSNPDSAIYYGLKAYSIGQKKHIANLAKPLNYVGISYNYKGDYLASYDYFNRALKLAIENNDSLQLAHAYNNIGRLFTEQGLLQKSSDYLFQAQRIFTTLKDLSGMAYSHQSLATYYKIKKNFTLAEGNFKKAYQIRLALGNTREIMSALIQLGKLYLENDNVGLALYYFEKADSTGSQSKNLIDLAEVKTLRAECLMEQGNLVLAEKLLGEGLLIIRGSKNLRLLPAAYLTMGQVQLKEGKFQDAKDNFTLALEASTLRKDLNARMEAYFFLWQTYKQQNKVPEELTNYTQYTLLKDSIRSLEMMNRDAQAKFELEIERKEAENELLKIREQRKSAIIIILVLLFISIVVFLFMQVKYKMKILRINHLLEDRNREIIKINSILENKSITLEKHMATLVEFSRNRSITIGNLAHAAKDIVSTTAKKLNISQVSIWLYDEEKGCIETLACYNQEQDIYRETVQLSFQRAPKYFKAIKEERILVADDARTHAYTHEFTDTYFIPQNIFSLLDVTFYLDGKLKGLLCCEQQHGVRKWSAEDKLFASSVADIITLAFRTSQRLEYEKFIKHQNKEIAHMNDVLEERVKKRTEELELKNVRMAEYAFINSHLLRGPVSRILGIINLMECDKEFDDEQAIPLLRTSGNELDQIVKKITDALSNGDYLTVKDLR